MKTITKFLQTITLITLFLIYSCSAKIALETNYTNLDLSSTHTSDLVEITKINPNIRIQTYYATENNFLKQVLYESPKCYLCKAVAQKLDKVQKELEQIGLGLKIWDGYRPPSAQRKMWEIYPNPDFVADPKKGSKHSRGAAVDLTLINLKDETELEMPTEFDDFSFKADRKCFDGLSQKAIENRQFLEDIMIKHGFIPYVCEWWHFNDDEWEKYPLLDINFSELE